MMEKNPIGLPDSTVGLPDSTVGFLPDSTVEESRCENHPERSWEAGRQAIGKVSRDRLKKGIMVSKTL